MTTEDALNKLEATVGHPADRWADLHDRVSSEGLTQFSSVSDDWLGLMWCLDSYRTAGICPRGMGNAKVKNDRRRLDAVYRGKGNWFSTLCVSLLENATHQRLGSRNNVQGFSQTHQIDIAWPAREIDVHVCAEAKVSGAPPQSDSGARTARADFASRRKELKFSATDLKLYRRDRETRIEHWGHWRNSASPRTFLLWGARLSAEVGESVEDLIHEGVALRNTYLDGVGLFAWQLRPSGVGYESVTVPPASGVPSLDDTLYFISTEISATAQAHGGEPEPVRPSSRAAETSAGYE